MYEPRDEISLRELYLIFRSGFLAIVLVALVAGAAAFLYLGSQPERFEATATVQVNVPVADTASEEAAWLLPPAGIGMSSYTALANRSDVIAAAFDLDASDLARLRELARRLELTAVDTSAQARGQLTVAHNASAPTAEEAAERANEWARATVAATINAMTQTVTANAEASTRELAEREAELAAARGAWTAFAQEDDRSVLSSQLSVQLQLQLDATLRLAHLNSLIAAGGAQRDLLQAAIDTRSGTGSRSLEAQLRAMIAAGALTSETAAQFERALSQLPPGVTTGSQDLLTLVSRTQVETLTGQLAAYVAESELLERTLANAGSQLASIRTRLADMNQRAEQLELELRAARNAYESVAALAPLIKLQQGMIGSAAKVVVPATPPLEPEARNRLTITLAAALVAGLLATLVVFLRAAIREPEPELGEGPHDRLVDIDPTSGNLKRTSDRLEERLTEGR